MGINGHMTAAVLYGRQDLKVERVEVPRIGPDEVLVRVKAALTCGTDLKVWRQGYHARMIKLPAVLGHELAGVVAQAGSEVGNHVRVGMRVVAANSAPCNECLFCRKDHPTLCEDLLFNNGAYAEYVTVPGRIVRQNVLEIPDHLSFVDAALVEPVACVLRGIRETGARPGDTTVVIGCGPIGLQFIRLLALRNIRVIAVGRRQIQVEAAERLGAAAAVDISRFANPVRSILELTEKHRGADSVIEAVGSRTTWEWAFQLVRAGGTVNLFGGCPQGTRVEVDCSVLHYSEITVKSSFHHTPQFIREALNSISRGDICAGDFVTAETPLPELPKLFQQLNRPNGHLKIAVIP